MDKGQSKIPQKSANNWEVPSASHGSLKRFFSAASIAWSDSGGLPEAVTSIFAEMEKKTGISLDKYQRIRTAFYTEYSLLAEESTLIELT